jgi:hypothetical protein
MTSRATFAQGLVFENERPALLAMALAAGFVDARHGQPAAWFKDVAAVWIVALCAIHFLFEHRMMLRQMELALFRPVAFETRRGIFAGIHDELPSSAASRNVQASGSVTRFATGQPCSARVLQTDANMCAGRKDSANIRVTFGATFFTDEGGTWYIGCGGQFEWGRRAGIEYECRYAC